MKIHHVRLERDIQISNALTFLAGTREQANEAWAGDVIGLHNHGTIQVGDTFTQGEKLNFTGIPYFAPELFKRVQLNDPLKQKALQKGLMQLGEEGATQVFKPLNSNDLIFNMEQMVSYISQYFTLQPGDMIWSGTMGSTRAMVPGDVYEVEIENVGVLRNEVVQGN